MTTAHWIRCNTQGCDAKLTSWEPNFDLYATAQGWQLSPPLCPDCASGGSVDPASERILVVPLTRGAFTAYAPEHMTAADWLIAAGACLNMARGGDVLCAIKELIQDKTMTQADWARAAQLCSVMANETRQELPT